MAAITRDIPKRNNFGVAIAYLGPAVDTDDVNRPVEVIRHVGQGTDRQVFLYTNSKYGIYIHNRSMHQAIASIIIDGKFQGSFLLEGRQSTTIKRGGHNVGSFVFLSHPTDWCRRNLHLPTLIENLCLGEIIVNIRPA